MSDKSEMPPPNFRLTTLEPVFANAVDAVMVNGNVCITFGLQTPDPAHGHRWHTTIVLEGNCAEGFSRSLIGVFERMRQASLGNVEVAGHG